MSVHPNSGGRPASTARTYPVDIPALLRAIEGSVRGLPGWTLESASDREVRAVRGTRLGGRIDVKVGLARLDSGDHTNTLAKFEGRARSAWRGPVHNRRVLRELTSSIDANLKPDA